MSYDLRAGLGDLGAAERAIPADLPVATLRVRARRRRATRVAVAGSVALATVAAITVAAVALPDVDAAPPPAATPSWTPDAAGWPPAITLDGPTPRCGEAMPALLVPDGEPVLVIEDAWATGPMVAGGVLELSGSTLTAPEDFPVMATRPSLLLVRDGIVVGIENHEDDSQSGVFYWSNEQPGVESGPELLDMIRCETRGRGPVPLDPGTYDLYVTQEVFPRGAPIDDPAGGRTVAAGPFPVVVERPSGDATPGP